MASPENFKQLMTDATYICANSPPTEAWRVYWKLLKDVPDGDLTAAFDKWHSAPGNFFPSPGDILAAVPKARVMAADEAWAICLLSFDESASVLYTRAIAAARSSARPIWEAGDKIGARMAFKAAYDREVIADGSQDLIMSLGHDPEGRAETILRARDVGAITHKRAAQLLPPDTSAAASNVFRLIAGKPATASKDKMMAAAKAALAASKESLATKACLDSLTDKEWIRRRKNGLNE